MTRYGFWLLLCALSLFSCEKDKVDFSTEVKPIINKRCISCHGGVKRNGGFSLLFRQDALDTTESGKHAIVPGHPEQSEMIRRLTVKDPEQRMPYKEEPLTSEEINILTKWIEQGAEWGDHWAYLPPKRNEIKETDEVFSGFGSSDGADSKNPIDHFVHEALKKQNLTPSAEADKATLIRRLYLDVIGIPPTLEEAQSFINDNDPNAYEKVVDKLLASPHYGEKWASWWLDLARYADTKGYERDAGRTIWRYRDWVIKAFNEDKPFDQFTIEQLAGDLLENPTDDQLIATAFHRNTMNNDEGGTEDEEFRTAAVLDRVNTTFEVWQSTTMSCVQCHSHPYDPFRHEEYYKSLAYFNNSRDEDTHGEHPNLRMYKPEDQEKLESIRDWIVNRSGDDKQEKEVTRFLKTLEPKIHPHDFDQFVNGELIDTKWLGIRSGGSARLRNVNLTNKENLFIDYWSDAHGGSLRITKDQLNGEVVADFKIPQTKGRQVIRIPLRPSTGHHDLYFSFRNPTIDKNASVCGIEWFAFRESLPGKEEAAFASIDKTFMALLNAKVENTCIMIENTADQFRQTHIFDRGNWLVKAEVVNPEVPKILNTSSRVYPGDRLGLAQWIVSPQNTLTSRVIVNRLWEQIFGVGLVETLEDFGTQGAAPSHPELLDWLALRMMEDHQWSIKKTLKDIFMSATYKQSSGMTEEMLQVDQANRWLARAPRVRLSAEQVRDQALAASGLLSKKMYGPSVMPFQPKGIWQSVWSGEYWKESEGEDKYRRGVYTYVKRTSPYPMAMMFDAASREVCLSRRIRTNTPLQALVTLNDSVFVDAARSLASLMAKKTDDTDEAIAYAYQRLTFKSLAQEKLEILEQLYKQAHKKYQSDPKASAVFLQQENADPHRAALTVVANALLNLDEVLMKE